MARPHHGWNGLRAGRDTVNLLAIRLDLPESAARLEMRGAGATTRLPVRLDQHGLAPLCLRDLPTGDYEVRWDGGPSDEPASICPLCTDWIPARTISAMKAAV